MGHDDYKGKIVIGKGEQRSPSAQTVPASCRIDREGNRHPLKVAQGLTHEGLKRTEVEDVTAGDIIA